MAQLSNTPLRARLVVGAIIFLAGCNGSTGDDAASDTPPPTTDTVEHTDDTVWFTESAADIGIDFTHLSGHDGETFYIPEVMSGGVATIDLDGDGWLDVYCVQSGSITATEADRPGNQLFRNRGDGTFEDVTTDSGADDRGYGMGVAAGDYDGDGDMDLYICNVGRNTMLRNDGDVKFTDVTDATNTGDTGFGSSAAFFDYDRDGDLDLWVLNYLVWSVETERPCMNALGQPDYCSPNSYNAPAKDVLYENNGDGTFTDVSAAAGIHASFGTGLGIVTGDFNGDHWPDVFVANDGRPDQLWVNQGAVNDSAVQFIDQATQYGVAIDQSGQAKAGMGVTAADVDHDGDLDVLVCNLGRETDSLFLNEGQFFDDRTAATGIGAVSKPFTRFGMAWVDFNNDGLFDLYQANGRVASEADRHNPNDALAEPNLLFKGVSSNPLKFEEVQPRGGTTEPLIHTSRAAAFGDLNNDGGVDIVVINKDAPVYVLMNTWGKASRDRRWVMLDAREQSGAPALGAQVSMTIGDQTIIRDVRSAYSYCAANDPRIHIGLGDASMPAQVTVRWGDGSEDVFPIDKTGGIITVQRPE